MSFFLITVGPPGAGKSTWADDNLPKSCLRIGRDRFREALFGSRKGYYDDALWGTIDHRTRAFVIGSAMNSAVKAWPFDLPIAMADTGVYWDSIKRFWDCRVKKRIVLFDTPLKVLIGRNQTRPEDHRVPEDVIVKYHHDCWGKDAWWRQARLLPHVSLERVAYG